MTTQPLTSPAPDPTLEANVFWFRYRKQIIAILLLAIVIMAAVAGYWLYEQRRDSAAADALASAKTPAELQTVTTQFRGTPAGATAYLLLAEQQRNEQKFAEANATLQAFLDKYPKHELASTARMAIAANQESLGKTDEALAGYKRIASSDAHGYNAPLALLAQVHILRARNQIDEARQVCETILTQYRDSIVAGEATRQLRLLKPTKSSASPAASSPSPAPSVPSTTASVPSAPAKP